MENIKLIDLKENLTRGAFLRCRGQYPYEEFVDFMVTELNDGISRGYGLLVYSGNNAGLLFRRLPDECIPTGKQPFGVSTEWLKSNWQKWGYGDCPLESVHVIYKDVPTDLCSL